MPYCEPCHKYHTPSAMNEDGTCPGCGEPVDEPTTQVANAGGESPEGSGPPWHFKLVIAVLVVYLGYRAFQGIEWVIHH